jgi:hypothetical protein
MHQLEYGFLKLWQKQFSREVFYYVAVKGTDFNVWKEITVDPILILWVTKGSR